MTERVLQKEDRISVAELTERMMKEYDMKREDRADRQFSSKVYFFLFLKRLCLMVLGSSSSISDNFAIHICHTPICSFHLHSLCVGSSLRALFARICAHRGSLFKSRRTGPA